ncbi:hypothetical protein M427DRAFT_37010 [Gonapodya prolifera JEL478]|uniref:Amino acid transporter n=1 Tax=Gonapodya prolifera (strain JEL478) TaxID=1344416 RepID=A0A139A1I6_GONPJ|nr:hypothetical protein M427DRAFT_37010 [Gonapodya prolifera JEL478]|eukprot:KXS10488.1 hypothetical protein M427DRAFT_37010 [Gonapodya prolifera JEL478]
MATTGMTDCQELKHSRGYIGIISSIVTLYSFAFKTGGPQAMLIGCPIVSFFTMSTCLSMVEICSAYPTAGGLYYWSAKLAGEKWGSYMAWIAVTDVTTLPTTQHRASSTSSACSLEVPPSGLLVASILAAAIQIYNPDFVPSLGWLYGVAIVYAFLGSATSSIGETLLRIFTWISLVGIATGVVILGVPLLVMLPTKASASFAFGTLVDKTGWGNSTLVFQLRFLQVPILPLGVFSHEHVSTIHVEETVNADTSPAKSIIYSLVPSIILGYIFLSSFSTLLRDTMELLALCTLVAARVTRIHRARVGAIPPWFATMGMYAAYTIPTICKLIWAWDTFKKSKINLGSFSTIINTIAALWLVYLVVILSIPCASAGAKVTREKISDSLAHNQRIPTVRTNLNLSPIMFVGVFLVINVIWFPGAKKTFTSPRQHITAEVEEMEKAKHEKIDM